MAIKNVVVAGSGVLGSQIAFQSAYRGFNVTIYDLNDDILKKADERFDRLAAAYKQDLKSSDDALKAARTLIRSTSDLAAAVKDADLVIEAVPENLELKKAFYQKLAAVAPAACIFVTNTSTLLPSAFAESTGRPDKFLALHFANEIWKHNTAEVMGHAGTDKKYFDQIVQFAKDIGMIALPLHKEQPGYILNSLLVPWLNASTALALRGVADIQTIDKTWMLGTGSPLGPFAALDIIGLMTPYQIAMGLAAQGHEPAKALAHWYKTEFIDKGKLGVATGEGFYQYPNPAYLHPDFLKS